jgi:hypothetical protein
MKLFLIILISLGLIAADVLFFVFVFFYTGDKNIMSALLLAAIIVHSILLYKFYSYEANQKEASTHEKEDFIFNKG